MYGVMSRELVREQAMIGMLGALCAEARVARFLVSLATASPRWAIRASCSTCA